MSIIGHSLSIADFHKLYIKSTQQCKSNNCSGYQGCNILSIFLEPFAHGCIQLNLCCMTKWSTNSKLTEQLAQWIKFHVPPQFRIVVHGKFIYNFCRQPQHEFQSNILSQELQLASLLNADVIIHQGKLVEDIQCSKLEALDNYVQGITLALDMSEQIGLTNKVILETSAKQGSELGYSLNELAYIYNQFSDHHQQRIGICVDLCHTFVSGELDARDINSIKSYFTNFTQLFSDNQDNGQFNLDKLNYIHYNDSKVKFGKCADRHEDIGFGFIGNSDVNYNGNIEGFKYIAQVATQHGIPMILETPCDPQHTDPKTQMDMVISWGQSQSQSQSHSQQPKLKLRLSLKPKI